MRKVKRRWFSKKKQTWVEKEYVYQHGKSTKGMILVNKKGKINQKNVDKFLESISNNKEISDDTKKEFIDLLQQKIQARKDANKELTTSGFRSLSISDPISRMFSNAGYSAEEIANEYGFDVDELLDESNWNGDVYKDEWEFVFTYTGSIFKRI